MFWFACATTADSVVATSILASCPRDLHRPLYDHCRNSSPRHKDGIQSRLEDAYQACRGAPSSPPLTNTAPVLALSATFQLILIDKSSDHPKCAFAHVHQVVNTLFRAVPRPKFGM